jgi:hypothetical protein
MRWFRARRIAAARARYTAEAIALAQQAIERNQK